MGGRAIFMEMETTTGVITASGNAKFVRFIYIHRSISLSLSRSRSLPIVTRIVSTFSTNAFAYASRRLYPRAICTRHRAKTMSATLRQPSFFVLLSPSQERVQTHRAFDLAKRRDDAKFSVGRKENPTTITSQGFTSQQQPAKQREHRRESLLGVF